MRDFQELMSTLNSPNGLKNVMQRPTFEHEDSGHQFSQADLIADIVNIMRMDTKQIGAAVGVEVEIQQMTPDRAAELLQQVAKGEGTELVEVFDEIENQRMMILSELADEIAEVEEFLAMKQSLLNTIPDDQDVVIPDEIQDQVAAADGGTEGVEDEN